MTDATHPNRPDGRADVVGFDPDRIEAWLSTVIDVAVPLRWDRLPGGHSNLTYHLTDVAGREMVIRRPPEGELLPKAHDMWREYRIIDGLWPTAVAVAEPIAFCDDRAVADTHFYVMGMVPGEALYSGKAVGRYLDEAAARVGDNLIATLAALHSIDPVDVGLAELGRPDHYVARQLKTWSEAWAFSSPIAEYSDDRVDEIHDLLASRIPEQGPGRIVHGDFSPHNILFSPEGEVQAVLDWELATLGDPLADFAYSINVWVEPGDPGVYSADPPTILPGFVPRSALIDRYAELTGADLVDLDFYRTLNYYKTGCILIGVYARYKSGQKSTEGVDLEQVFDRAAGSLTSAVQFAERLT